MSVDKRKAYMHIEGVPNPNAMKFVLENGILVDQPYEFRSLSDCANSPIAQKLMMLRYVDRVMLNSNYITVLKDTEKSPAWDEILFELRAIIQGHLENDEAIIYVGSEALGHTQSEDIVVGMVKDVLDKSVRPAAQEDGGDIVFESYDKGVLYLRMHGACHKCPYINETIKKGVEPVMRELIPEVREVRPYTT